MKLQKNNQEEECQVWAHKMKNFCPITKITKNLKSKCTLNVFVMIMTESWHSLSNLLGPLGITLVKFILGLHVLDPFWVYLVVK